MQKKILAFLLTLCMLLGMFPMAIMAEGTDGETAVVEETTTPVEPETEGAESTESTAIAIGTADELLALMHAENPAEAWAKDYYLTADIDLSEATNGLSPAPIGNNVAADKGGATFSGSFDGKNFEISNLNLSGANYQALFGKTSGDVTVQNLTVSGTINVTGDAGNAAGIIGHATGNVTIKNVVNNVDVTGKTSTSYIGGFIGEFVPVAANTNLYIENCVNNGDISGKSYLGGIVGYIGSSYSGHAVTITGCVNNGNMNGGTAGSGASGILAYVLTKATDADNHMTVTITKCANYGDMHAKSLVGGILGATHGSNYSGTTKYYIDYEITEVYNSGKLSAEAGGYVGAIAGILRVPYVKEDNAAPFTFSDWMHAGPSTDLAMMGTVGGVAHNVTVTNAYNSVGVGIAGTSDGPVATTDEGTVNGTIANLLSSTASVLETYRIVGSCDASANTSADMLATLAAQDAWTTGNDGKPMLKAFYVACDHSAVTDADIVITAPTCTEEGSKVTTCPVCKQVFAETIAIDKDAHPADATFTSVGAGNTVTVTYDCCDALKEVITVDTVIDSAEDLLALMNQEDAAYLALDYTLGAEIDMTDVAGQSPIGSDSVRFTGSLDGKNFTVKGINIEVTAKQTGTEANAGFFSVTEGATIKNLTLQGTVVTSTANLDYTAGLIGKAVAPLTVDNVTVDVDTNSGGYGNGGFVGDVIFATKNATVSITNSVNKGDVSATLDVASNAKYAAGFVGIIGGSTASGATFVISNCVNYGAITAAGDSNGGILGFNNYGKTGGKVVITQCANYGDVKSTGTASSSYYVGGIIGKFNGSSNNYETELVLTECYNAGTITSGTGSFYGAIIGAYLYSVAGEDGYSPVTMINLLNEGNDAPMIGSTGTVNMKFKASNLYNKTGAGIVSSGTTVREDINGEVVGNSNANNTPIIELSGCCNNASSAEDLAALAENDAWCNPAAPSLLFMHEHVADADRVYVSAGEDGHYFACPCGKDNGDLIAHEGETCVCGYVAHEHVAASEEITVPATCDAVGEKVMTCACGETWTVVIEKDATNHANNTTFAWAQDATTGTYFVACSACDANAVEGVIEPVVYVDDENGDDANSGLTVDAAVATLAEAASRLAACGGTVAINGLYTVSNDITFPEWAGVVKFTSATFDKDGKATSGIEVGVSAKNLFFNGDALFDGILFTSDAASTKRINFYMNWNNAEFKYVRATNLTTAYLIAGSNATASDDAATTTTLNVAGVDCSENDVVTSGSEADYFFDRIYMGGIFAKADIDVANKTVYLNMTKGYDGNDGEADVTNAVHLVYMTTATANKNYQSSVGSNHTAVLTLRDDTALYSLYTGAENMNKADVAGQIDNVVVNMYDNSQIAGATYMRNVVNTVVNISNETADAVMGQRTVPMNHSFRFYKYGAFLENTTAAATVNYGSHSFVSTIAAPVTVNNADSPYLVTYNTVNECVEVGEGVITTEPTPDAAGVRTFYCECGRATRTEEVLWACDVHAYVAKADETYYCSVCGETVEAPVADVVVAAVPATIVNGKTSVSVSVNGNAFVGVRFEITVPEGMTLTEVENKIGEMTESSATGWTLVNVGDNFALIFMGTSEGFADAAMNGEVLVLHFDVAETVENAVVGVTAIEAYNAAEEAVSVIAVSAEVAVGEIIPEECKHETTTTVTVDATCTTDGSITVTCDDCGEVVSTEVIPKKHIMIQIEDPVSATCEKTGKTAVMACANGCGLTVGGEETPVEDHDMQLSVKEIAPTCEKAGKTALMGCTYGCGTGEGGEEIPALGHNMVKTADAVEPTCTVAGKTAVYTCANNCGKIEGGEVIPATGHDHDEVLTPATRTTDAFYTYTCACGDSYTKTVETVDEEIGYYVNSLELQAEYILWYWIPRTAVANTSDFWMEFVATDVDGVETASSADSTKEDSTDYGFMGPAVPAKNMNDKVVATLYYIRDGIKYRAVVDGEVYESNVAAYCVRQINKFATAGVGTSNYKTREILIAVLNYGSAAQVEFKYNTTAVEGDIYKGLVNLRMDESLRKSALADFQDVTTTATRTYENEELATKFQFYANSAELKQRIITKFYFKLLNGTTKDDFANYTFIGELLDAKGNVVETYTIDGADWGYDGDAEILLADPAAADLCSMVRVKIVDAEGNQVSNTGYSCFEAYAAGQLAKSNVKDTNKALLKAILVYSRAAYNKFR